MKVKFKTDELKGILEVVTKGMGKGVILPITEFIEFTFLDGALFVTSTDLTSWVTYKKEFESDLEGEEEVSVIIHGDKLTQLINKTTVPEVEIEILDDCVKIKGNGEYKVPTLQEEFPDYTFEPSGKSYDINIAELKKAIDENKTSVSKDMIMPCLAGYYLSNKVITTDSIKMTINDIDVLGEDELLLPKEVADLLDILDREVGVLEIGDGNLLIDTDNITIFGPILDGIEEYPDLENIISVDFPAEVELNIKNLTSVLERLDVFSEPYDINVVELIFEPNFVTIKNRGKSTVERLNYSKKIKFKEDEVILVDLGNMLQLVKNTPGDVIRLGYGVDGIIRLENDYITHFLCQVEEE